MWFGDVFLIENVMNVKQLNPLKTDLAKGKSGQSDTGSNLDLKKITFFSGGGPSDHSMGRGPCWDRRQLRQPCQHHKRRTCKFSLCILSVCPSTPFPSPLFSFFSFSVLLFFVQIRI